MFKKYADEFENSEMFMDETETEDPEVEMDAPTPSGGGMNEGFPSAPVEPAPASDEDQKEPTIDFSEALQKLEGMSMVYDKFETDEMRHEPEDMYEAFSKGEHIVWIWGTEKEGYVQIFLNKKKQAIRKFDNFDAAYEAMANNMELLESPNHQKKDKVEEEEEVIEEKPEDETTEEETVIEEQE